MLPAPQPILTLPMRVARRLHRALVYLGALAALALLALALVPPLRHSVSSWLGGASSTSGQPEPEGELASVTTVLDGDTFVLADGRSVRILGIDTPELHNSNMAHPQPYAKEAATRLSDLLLGHRVRLERDAEDQDKYGRSLRHVWSDDALVSETLAGEGLAYALTVGPGTRYAERIRHAEAQAKALRRGVWSIAYPTLPVPAGAASAGGATQPTASDANGAVAPDAPCGARVAGAIPAESAGDFVDSVQAVEFTVVDSRDTGKISFLNSQVPFQGSFYVAIFPDLYGDFPAPPAAYFRGKCVLAQGSIQMYKGSPQIVIHRAEDIRVLDP